MSDFTCPRCGGHTWGSSYNFDGPGDTPTADDAPGKPIAEVIAGASSTRYEGTFKSPLPRLRGEWFSILRVHVELAR